MHLEASRRTPCPSQARIEAHLLAPRSLRCVLTPASCPGFAHTYIRTYVRTYIHTYIHVGPSGSMWQFWVFFRVKQRKQLVLQCFEVASNVWDGTSQTHIILVFAVFTVGSRESPGKQSISYLWTPFRTTFSGIHPEAKIATLYLKYQPHALSELLRRKFTDTDTDL